ncbi:hypothetical protein CASFOL_017860 [Castilleja foliolosa]|uniref:Uncharacterized protein n=1 Tax=Castilleja foliolosa TaxID=1961234 RepID=A0ABD3D9E9_9LAMI
MGRHRTVNLRLDARTISVILKHAQSKLVFVDYQSESLVVEAISLFPEKSIRPLLVLITDDDGELGISGYEAMVSNGDSKACDRECTGRNGLR